MRRVKTASLIVACALCLGPSQAGAATIFTNLDKNDSATPETEETGTYVFTNAAPGDATVPNLSSADLANGVTPVILTGLAHGVSGAITKLTDGTGASGLDDPPNNFFYNDAADTTGGKQFRIDLASQKSIGQINSYSWHHGDGNRAPQTYQVYGAAAGVGDLTDHNSAGWSLIASVASAVVGGAGANAGQQAVSIQPSSGTSLGSFQHFIFDVQRPTGVADTFFSEIDIVAAVPEPSSWALLAVALLGLAGWKRPRR